MPLYQEKKRGSPEGLWFVPAAAYTGLMRSLREGVSVSVYVCVCLFVCACVAVTKSLSLCVCVCVRKSVWQGIPVNCNDEAAVGA